MSSIDELKQMERAHHARVSQSLDIDAIVQDSTDLPTNKVRVYRQDIRQSVVVNGIKYRPGLYVYLRERSDHELHITDVNVQQSTLIFGEAVGAMTIPPDAHETASWSIPASGFVPGRVEPSQLGGLYLHVRPFHYDRGFWDGDALDPVTGLPTLNDFSVASSVPGTATYARWSIPYLDPATGTLAVADGDLQYVGSSGVTQLRETDIEAIVLPDDVYPLDAVGLMYGQTEITAASRIAGGRYHLALKRSSAVRATYSSANVSNPPTTAELTSAFGAPATLGAGFIAVVNDNGAGAAEYLCWSDGTSWFYASGTLAL